MAIKTFTQIVSSMISRIRGAQPSVDTKVGTFTRDVTIEPTANEISILYNEIDHVSKAQSVETGTGTDVVRLAENFGLRRKASTRATGNITFYRSAVPSADITIPVGTLVSTVSAPGLPAQVFATTSAATLPVLGADAYYNATTGRYEVSTSIRASNGGAAGDVAASSIVVLSSAIDGIQGCTNADVTAGGTDQESIEDLRVRVRNVLAGNAVVTQAGLEQLVASYSGVEDTSVEEYSVYPGTVAIYVKGQDTAGAVDSFEYTTDQLKHVFEQRPATTSSDITVVGSTSGTLTEGVDYSITEDTGVYAGTTKSRSCITWLTTLAAQTITLTYGYNSLVARIQSVLDGDNYHALGQSVLVKEATAVPINITARVRILDGYSFGTTSTGVQGSILSALTQLLAAYSLGEDVQQSDIVAAIAAVPGVDEVQLPLATFNGGTITQNSFGDLEIPSGYYATSSGASITITQ